ncbi:hypothetical protein HPO96_06305 [Kribbella sandramycini]|uniref:DUF2231 domain-containing protein n=1 Tax=Kribbella sandramycini TaxID=60450 RepID=A0A7Y4KXU0_9ACTN|nr:hypothetical protein [Kribbella sandramycini]MBB6567545.1 hypothetical protein [Kribbella sandramycini]NOL39851.1 hypothetical protein [Kribbella sandramycini]
MFRTVPADAVAIVRAYPPMVVCFAAALTGTALVFDVFYLVASPGLALALVYTVPVLAGLIAGLVAAADDVGLERRVLLHTVAAAVVLGITNAIVVAMLAAMSRTGPSDWADGGQAVLFAACSIFAIAGSINICRRLIDALGIELRTKLPRREAQPAPAVAVTPVSKESAARAETPPPPPPPPAAEEEQTVPIFVPPPPKVVDLDEARTVSPSSGGHASARSRRTSSRRPNKPGRRPGY